MEPLSVGGAVTEVRRVSRVAVLPAGFIAWCADVGTSSAVVVYMPRGILLLFCRAVGASPLAYRWKLPTQKGGVYISKGQQDTFFSRFC